VLSRDGAGVLIVPKNACKLNDSELHETEHRSDGCRSLSVLRVRWEAFPAVHVQQQVCCFYRMLKFFHLVSYSDFGHQ
jgi:hypothetical protein